MMQTKKIRSYVYIIDGEEVVGKVKTQAQARSYSQSYSKLRTATEFEDHIQQLVDFTCSVDEEIGYEFETAEQVLDCLKKRWPEVYAVSVGFGKIGKIFLSGRGWHLILTIVGDNIYTTFEDLGAMTEFNKNCKKFDLELEDYKKNIKVIINGTARDVMPVGFHEGRVICQLSKGEKKWLVSPVTVLRAVSFQ